MMKVSRKVSDINPSNIVGIFAAGGELDTAYGHLVHVCIYSFPL